MKSLLKRFTRKPMTSADEADQMVIENIRKHGSDLSKPRSTTHFLYFPTREGADYAADRIRPEVDSIVVEPSPIEEGRWSVVADHVIVVSLPRIREIRDRFDRLAAEQGGVYDGWEAAVD